MPDLYLLRPECPAAVLTLIMSDVVMRILVSFKIIHGREGLGTTVTVEHLPVRVVRL